MLLSSRTSVLFVLIPVDKSSGSHSSAANSQASLKDNFIMLARLIRKYACDVLKSYWANLLCLKLIWHLETCLTSNLSAILCILFLYVCGTVANYVVRRMARNCLMTLCIIHMSLFIFCWKIGATALFSCVS